MAYPRSSKSILNAYYPETRRRFMHLLILWITLITHYQNASRSICREIYPFICSPNWLNSKMLSFITVSTNHQAIPHSDILPLKLKFYKFFNIQFCTIYCVHMIMQSHAYLSDAFEKYALLLLSIMRVSQILFPLARWILLLCVNFLLSNFCTLFRDTYCHTKTSLFDS
jgi:hypothetical protein